MHKLLNDIYATERMQISVASHDENEEKSIRTIKINQECKIDYMLYDFTFEVFLFNVCNLFYFISEE